MLSILFIFNVEAKNKNEEYEKLPIYEGIGEGDLNLDNDPLPTSQYAFVSYYSGDDQWSHYYLNVLMQGYALSCLSPKYDRVLLLPTNLELDQSSLNRLQKVFTYIIRRPFMKWTCYFSSGIEEDKRDKHIWFKLQAYTLFQYRRIILFGPNVLISKDPSQYFRNGNSAPPDYQLWTLSHLGIIRNYDFQVIVLNHIAYNNISKLGCNWIAHPNATNDRQRNSFKYPPSGIYDCGLLEDFYMGSLITLPYWVQFELIQPKKRPKLAPDDPFDPRIISYRYTSEMRPWVLNHLSADQEFFADVFTYCAIETFKAFGEDIDLKKFQLRNPINESAKFVVNHWKKPYPQVKYIIYEFYNFCEEGLKMKSLISIFSIIVASISIIHLTIISTPQSSLDITETLLFE